MGTYNLQIILSTPLKAVEYALGGVNALLCISVKPVQKVNASSSIEFTLTGIVIEVRPVQYEKALFPIKVTLSGILTEVKPLQPENTLS